MRAPHAPVRTVTSFVLASSRFLIVVLGLLGPLASASGQNKWVRVRSAHFDVVSDDGYSAATKIASQLENMRCVLHFLMPTARLAFPAPLQVIAIKDSATITHLAAIRDGKPSNDAGEFIPDPDAEFILLNLSDARWQQAVYHEYAHAFLGANTSAKVGLWFEEGFAEYLSTLQEKEGQAKVGLPELRALNFLRSEHKLLTVRDLFRITREMSMYNVPGEYHSLFYAESWLLVHFLFDHHEVPNALELFSRIAGDGSLDEAVRAAFDTTSSRVDAQLADYARREQFGYGQVAIARTRPEEYEREALSDVEFQALLADVRVHSREDSKRGGDELQAFVTVDRRSMAALRALGYLELRTGNVDLAREYFTQANSIRPNARTHYYLGLLDNSDPGVTGDPAHPQLEAVREHMARCLAQEPTFAAAFDLLGHALTAQGRLRDALDAFKQAANLGPRTDSYTLDLVEIELGLGLAEQDARANLRYLLKSSDAAVAARAARLMFSTAASFDNDQHPPPPLQTRREHREFCILCRGFLGVPEVME